MVCGDSLKTESSQGLEAEVGGLRSMGSGISGGQRRALARSSEAVPHGGSTCTQSIPGGSGSPRCGRDPIKHMSLH